MTYAWWFKHWSVLWLVVGAQPGHINIMYREYRLGVPHRRPMPPPSTPLQHMMRGVPLVAQERILNFLYSFDAQAFVDRLINVMNFVDMRPTVLWTGSAWYPCTQSFNQVSECVCAYRETCHYKVAQKMWLTMTSCTNNSHTITLGLLAMKTNIHCSYHEIIQLSGFHYIGLQSRALTQFLRVSVMVMPIPRAHCVANPHNILAVYDGRF